MRFYFRVKEAPQAQQHYNRLRKQAQRQQQQKLNSLVMTVVHQPVLPLLPLTEIKEETAEPEETTTKELAVQPQQNTLKIPEKAEPSLESLKITLVNKPQQREQSPTPKSTSTPNKRVDNIKLKIDLAKQNSVTIINKEIVHPSKSDKEWKVKTKKDKCKEKRERERSSSPLTVPPLTIKAERISPLANTNHQEEDKKSLFLKSFALTPTKAIKIEANNNKSNSSVTNVNLVKPTTPTIPPKLINSKSNALLPVLNKRKNKEALRVSNIVKKPKSSPPLSGDDFKIKLPPQTLPLTLSLPLNNKNNSKNNDNFAIPKLPIKRMANNLPKRGPKYAPPGSLTPHPHADVVAPPGNRTPIAKRYQPILPKAAARSNPFANLAPVASDVNIMLQDAASENTNLPPAPTKVYGPKQAENTIMGPPLSPIKTQNKPKTQNTNNSYLNMALMNAAKSKGTEAPAGSRTPNSSPSYSPNSPQYSPNYNIPTMPTYKYTPKPGNDYLQSVLAATSNKFANLFPTPPTRKASSESNKNTSTPTKTTESTVNSTNSGLKRVYPFSRSPSPVRPLEDAPEKQLKVKSLLNSCNINIPSSLSITITRDDGESTATGSTHPKHKSPVNNYIEILKLPEQTPTSVAKETNENIKDNKQQQQHQNASSTTTTTTTTTTNYNKNNTSKRDMVKLMLPPPPPQKSTLQNLHNLTVNSPKSSPPMPNMNKPPTPPLGMHNFNGKLNVPEKKGATSITLLSTPTTNQTSPEKAKSSNNTCTTSNNSNNKSPPESVPSAAKKFRHILPRQNATPIAEVIPPKVTSANIIGTYSSPSGIAVKIHGNSTTTTTTNNNNNNSSNNNNNNNHKKTPTTSPTEKKQPNIRSPTSTTIQSNKSDTQKLTTTTAPLTNKNINNSNNNNSKEAIVAQQQHHVLASAAAAAAFKDNFLRAQVAQAQAMQIQFAAAAAQHHPPTVAANAANMFYAASYAAAAQQLQQQQQASTPPALSPLHVPPNNSTLYNFQQAIMEQLSRKAAVLNEYMQKYKQDVTATAATNNNSSNSQMEKVKKSSNSSPAMSKLSAKLSNGGKNINKSSDIISRSVTPTTMTTTTTATTIITTPTTNTTTAVKKCESNAFNSKASLSITVSEQLNNSNSIAKSVNNSETVKSNSSPALKSK